MPESVTSGPNPPAHHRPSLERLAFAALTTLTLSPAVLQGLWRPLAQALSVQADSVDLALASLGIGAAAVGVAALGVRALWPGLAAALLAILSGLALGGDWPARGAVTLALLGVAAFNGALVPWLLARLPEALDGLATRRKGAAALWALLAVGTVVGTARLSVFMGDASRPELSMMPELPFLVKHSCLTAYVQGARFASDGVENLYETTRWPDLHDSPESRATAAAYAPFKLDAYAYPPPFLLLPRLLLTPLGDFASQRALWYAFNAVFAAASFWSVARWIGGTTGLRALLLTPLLWMSQQTFATFQVGNAHLAVIAATLLALVAFETRRPALGGALLAFTTLAKISPGLLILVLLLQRRFREVAWTAAWGVAFTLAGAAAFGIDPYLQFVGYELPRLSSGEALTFLALPESVEINWSPFGIPFRLASFGFDLGDEWALGRSFTKVYSLVLLGLTLVAARKGGGPAARAELWMALLTLGALRSPLAPGYVLVALLWLLALRAGAVRGLGGALGLAALWIGISFTPPLTGLAKLAQALGQQGLLFGVAFYYLLRKPSPAESDQGGPQPA